MRPHVRVANLLALSSTASALSLSSFQIITSSSVPLSCILAYDTQISGCATDDFQQGRSCSAGCVRALQKIEDDLATACNGVSVPSSSVLGQALSGGLVDLLCPSGKKTTTTAATTSSTAATVTTQTTRQVGTFSTIPKPTTLHTSSTSTSTSSSESAPPAKETSQTTGFVVNPTQTTVAQQTKAPQQSTPDHDLGGGSPFDIATVSTSSGSRQSMDRWLEAFLFANIFVFLLLR